MANQLVKLRKSFASFDAYLESILTSQANFTFSKSEVNYEIMLGLPVYTTRNPAAALVHNLMTNKFVKLRKSLVSFDHYLESNLTSQANFTLSKSEFNFELMLGLTVYTTRNPAAALVHFLSRRFT